MPTIEPDILVSNNRIVHATEQLLRCAPLYEPGPRADAAGLRAAVAEARAHRAARTRTSWPLSGLSHFAAHQRREQSPARSSCYSSRPLFLERLRRRPALRARVRRDVCESVLHARGALRLLVPRASGAPLNAASLDSSCSSLNTAQYSYLNLMTDSSFLPVFSLLIH